MEARSVEDDDFAYCVFCYNVQPGIEIDYATGDSSPAVQDDRSLEAAGRDEEKQTAEPDHAKSDAVRSEEEKLQDAQTDAWNSDNTQTEGEDSNNAPSGETAKEEDSAESPDYILNTSSQKFHKPDCDSVESMAEHNKKAFYGTRDEAIAQGYDPCKRCNP